MSRSSLWVGVHAGEFNGIDTYAEQMALAAIAAGHDVTLVATDAEVAAKLTTRLAGDGVRIDHLGLAPLRSKRALLERFLPSGAVQRHLAGLRAFAASRGLLGATWHFNRPALALAITGPGTRVCVAAWFYPHRLFGRLRETWNHVGGPVLRRAVISAKALDYYRWDACGYRAASWVVSPTERLGQQLTSQGHRVVVCPPPSRLPSGLTLRAERNPSLRFLVCSGDLAHPRKNLRQAIEALAQLSSRHGPITLAAVGRHPEALGEHATRAAPQLHIEALGVLEPAQVREEMQRCDALLLPSRYEEWGYVAVESLLCGTPVVTFPVYPFDEMLADGLGSVAAGREVASYAAAIERSLSLQRGGPLSRAAAARFGSAAVGARLSPLWARTDEDG